MRTSFKLIRNKNGLTQKELAEKVGLAEISIRKIENGERDPSINTAVRISKILNTKMEIIFPDIFLITNDTK
ncbi:helix-turn-helix transcriptional regulator, partial [Listeria monocytogenes]|nr:helix-turn-helix transcriptional regulator [Listeria monocytogenes]